MLESKNNDLWKNTIQFLLKIKHFDRLCFAKRMFEKCIQCKLMQNVMVLMDHGSFFKDVQLVRSLGTAAGNRK